MDCERLNSPVLSFVDINGKPLVGGKLYTYLAGTSTPATTYRDIEGTDANENPIVLNGRGECVCFLDCSKTYKVVLKDSHDVVIWAQDNVLPNNIAELSRIVVDNSGAIDELNDKKADKVPGATSGNLAGLNSEGNLTDSGYKPGDFAPSSLGDVAVRVDIEQDLIFDDAMRRQGRANIKAQKAVGGPGAFVDGNMESDEQWADIGTLSLKNLGIYTGGSLSACYSNISLSLELTVYNTGNTDGAIVERGRFDINVHASPSESKWNYDAQWTSYDSRVAGTHIIELMRVCKNMGSGSEVESLTIYAKLPSPSSFNDNALNVSVLNNYGCAHKNDTLNTCKSFVSPWNLHLGVVFRNLLGINEIPISTNTFIPSFYDSYVDFPTVHTPRIAVLNSSNYTPSLGNDAAKRGDIPFIMEDGGVAIPFTVTDTEQEFLSLGANRGAIFFKGGVLGNSAIKYMARLSSTDFKTPNIDTTTAGLYLVGEGYLYPMDGQTHSISVYFEVVDPDSSVYNVLATWRRSGTDDPKEFKIAVTYFGNTVGCWHGTKTLSTTETNLTITDFEYMVKMEIDFISTDGERWYHFEYIKEANRSRMVEY